MEKIEKAFVEIKSKDEVLCYFCNKSCSKRVNKKVITHINIMQTPKVKYFCSMECKLNYI